MAYVITHSDSVGDIEISCETPGEAFSILIDLIGKEAKGIMVANYETGEEAIETLKILVDHARYIEATKL